jgi:hypothetical protein
VRRPAGEAVPDGYDLLFVVRADGRLAPVTQHDRPDPNAGDTLVLLGPTSSTDDRQQLAERPPVIVMDEPARWCGAAGFDQGEADDPVGDPLLQASVPALVAALACCHLSFAVSVGGRSSCRIHRRVAEATAEATSSIPVTPRRPPSPTSTAPPTTSPWLTWILGWDA